MSWSISQVFAMILVWQFEDFKMVASTLTIATSLSYYAFENTVMSELEENDQAMGKLLKQTARKILKHETSKRRFFRITSVLMVAWFANGYSYHSYGLYNTMECISITMQGIMKGVLAVPHCLISAWIVSRSKQKVIPASVLRLTSATTYFILVYITKASAMDQLGVLSNEPDAFLEHHLLDSLLDHEY